MPACRSRRAPAAPSRCRIRAERWGQRSIAIDTFHGRPIASSPRDTFVLDRGTGQPMSVKAGKATPRPAHSVHISVHIREHRIPSAHSAPYICVEGPDRNLWFCESGAAKIGRFDPRSGTFAEFALPTAGATPIGITLGGAGNLWFAQKRANKIGCISPGGALAEFPPPTENAGPDGFSLGPDGNVWFSETEVSQIGCITSDGKITEFKTGN